MKRHTRFCLLAPLAFAILLATPPATAEDDAGANDRADSIGEALSGGEFSLGFRYRLERVSIDGQANDGEASTLRTTLGYRSKTYRRTSVFLEVENVLDLGLADNHANAGAGSLSNGVRDRPVIADPEITEFNQAYLRFELSPSTRLDAGRREIALDNQRWVGPVGWRQNHQSFDTVMLESRPTDELSVTYAYLDNVNRLIGDNLSMSSHLLNAGYQFDAGKLTAYGYFLDYDDRSASTLSTSTLGLRFAGGRKLGGERRLRYVAEIAQQSDAGDNPASIDARYTRIEIGADSGALEFDLGREVLGADEGRITTPLATLHGFNGWADQFLSTPGDGLVDLSAAVGWSRDGWTARAIYHDFSTDRRDVDLGTELDLLVSRKLSGGAVIAAKAALYSADTFRSDTEKVWLWAAKTF